MNEPGHNFGSKDIYSEQTASIFSAKLTQPGGWFWHRLGGSDFETVARQRSVIQPQGLTRILGRLESRARGDRSRVRNLNGFFDLNPASFEETFREYVSILASSYRDAEGFTYGGKALIDHFNGIRVSRGFPGTYADSLVRGKYHLTYEFIEAIYPMFATMSEWMTNRKVLVISPFSKSVEHQFEYRSRLFRELRFPEFELVTYNTAITYNNSMDIENQTLSSKTSNWVEELALMKSEVSSIDFDIALLSCGSYAGPLGVHISSMGKKSIYLGGVLNILFNIFGQRYDTDYVRAIIDPATTIDAIETAEITSRSGGKSVPNEALRAYLR